MVCYFISAHFNGSLTRGNISTVTSRTVDDNVVNASSPARSSHHRGSHRQFSDSVTTSTASASVQYPTGGGDSNLPTCTARPPISPFTGLAIVANPSSRPTGMTADLPLNLSYKPPPGIGPNDDDYVERDHKTGCRGRKRKSSTTDDEGEKSAGSTSSPPPPAHNNASRISGSSPERRRNSHNQHHQEHRQETKSPRMPPYGMTGDVVAHEANSSRGYFVSLAGLAPMVASTSTSNVLTPRPTNFMRPYECLDSSSVLMEKVQSRRSIFRVWIISTFNLPHFYRYRLITPRTRSYTLLTLYCMV